MQILVKSPIGTEISINLESETVSIAKVAMVDQPIAGWGVTRHDGKTCEYVKVGGKNIVISNDDLKTVADARSAYKQQKLEQAVPGVALLRDVFAQKAIYREEFARMMEDESNDGVNPPKQPDHDIDSLINQYPRAALYLRAESYERASNYIKSVAGKQAMDMLENGLPESEAKALLDNWHNESFAG